MKYASLRYGLQLALCPSINGGGGIVPDLSGRGNHGVLTNMDANDYLAGPKGRVLDFDGVNDQLNTTCPGITTIARSVSLWFRTSTSYTLGTYGFLLRWGTAATFPADQGKDFAVVIGNDAQLGTNGFGVTQYGDSVGVTGLNDGAWRHAYIESLGSTYSIWIDGRFRVSKSMTTNATAGTVVIGAAYGLPFLGQMNDIRAYSRTLAAQEIRLLASEPGLGIRPERASVFFGAQLFNAAWARNSNVIISPVGAA